MLSRTVRVDPPRFAYAREEAFVTPYFDGTLTWHLKLSSHDDPTHGSGATAETLVRNASRMCFGAGFPAQAQPTSIAIRGVAPGGIVSGDGPWSRR